MLTVEGGIEAGYPPESSVPTVVGGKKARSPPPWPSALTVEGVEDRTYRQTMFDNAQKDLKSFEKL